MIVHGHQVFKTYLAFKLHFSKENYDFFEANGQGRSKEKSYQQRNDFYFFETLARKLKDEEIKEYMLASFVSSENPEKVWIGDVKRNGYNRWLVWQKLQGSLTYVFSSDCDELVKHMEIHQYNFNQLFETTKGHPPSLKLLFKQKICLETLLIMDMILGFGKVWDKELRDPLWQKTSFKIKKYKPFLSIPVNKYKDILRNKFHE